MILAETASNHHLEGMYERAVGDCGEVGDCNRQSNFFPICIMYICNFYLSICVFFCFFFIFVHVCLKLGFLIEFSFEKVQGAKAAHRQQ